MPELWIDEVYVVPVEASWLGKLHLPNRLCTHRATCVMSRFGFFTWETAPRALSSRDDRT